MKRNVPRTPVTHKAEVSATITEENRGVVEKSILYEAIYSVGGLILGLLCIVGGIILSILGVSGSGTSCKPGGGPGISGNGAAGKSVGGPGKSGAGAPGRSTGGPSMLGSGTSGNCVGDPGITGGGAPGHSGGGPGISGGCAPGKSSGGCSSTTGTGAPGKVPGGNVKLSEGMSSLFILVTTVISAGCESNANLQIMEATLSLKVSEYGISLQCSPPLCLRGNTEKVERNFVLPALPALSSHVHDHM